MQGSYNRGKLSGCRFFIKVRRIIFFVFFFLWIYGAILSFIPDPKLWAIRNLYLTQPTITSPELPRWRRCSVFIVNFEHISNFFLEFPLLTLNKLKMVGQI